MFFFVWSIADIADANGWVRMGKDVTWGKGLMAFFSFFSSLFSLLVAVLAGINIVHFWRREPPESRGD